MNRIESIDYKKDNLWDKHSSNNYMKNDSHNNTQGGMNRIELYM